MKEADAYKLYDYAVYMNTKVVPEISRIAEEYRRIMSSPANAEATLRANGFDFDLLTKMVSIRIRKAVGYKRLWERKLRTKSGKMHSPGIRKSIMRL